MESPYISSCLRLLKLRLQIIENFLTLIGSNLLLHHLGLAGQPEFLRQRVAKSSVPTKPQQIKCTSIDSFDDERALPPSPPLNYYRSSFGMGTSVVENDIR